MACLDGGRVSWASGVRHVWEIVEDGQTPMMGRRSWTSRLGGVAFRVLEQGFDPSALSRYREENEKLNSEVNPRPRLVTMGDSLLEGWAGLEDLALNGARLINRGISGQTTTQMLLRFTDDVVSLKPVAVFILAGANDIRLFLAGAEQEQAACRRVYSAVTKMADLAVVKGIAVGIGLLPPLRSAGRPPAAVVAVNAWLAEFAASRHFLVADFHSCMADSRGEPIEAFTRDGVHPSVAGYAAMAKALAPIAAQLTFGA